MFQAFQWHILLLTPQSVHEQESRDEEKSTSEKSSKRLTQLFLSQTTLCIWKTASLLSIYKIALIFYEDGKGFSFLLWVSSSPTNLGQIIISQYIFNLLLKKKLWMLCNRSRTQRKREWSDMLTEGDLSPVFLPQRSEVWGGCWVLQG